MAIVGSTVHLSDLFSGLDPGQDCALGPAPSPGSNIVVGQAQLQAIADEFGVSWNATAGWQSVTLSRRGQPLTRAMVIAALRRSLVPLGISRGSAIALSAWTDQSVDPGSRLSIQNPVFDPGLKRFAAVLLVSVDGQEVSQIAVDGTVTAMTTVAVPMHAILAGQVLAEDDLVAVERPRDQLTDDAFPTISDAVGLMAVRPLSEGQPIGRSALRAPPLVSRGSVVMLHLAGGGLTLSAEGLAIDTGAVGDRVRVINPSSRVVLVGTVSGHGIVSIDPDSTPMETSGGVGNAALPPGFPGGSGRMF